MIINFSIQNFGSIKDKQTLTFEADNSTHLEDSYVIHASGYRLLKMALIYGANASGKTTVLNALEFLRDLVLEPASKKTDELDFQPFLFDPETPQQNSVLAIEFLQEGIKYAYEVEFFKQAIVREKLDYHAPNKANVFNRNTNISNQFTEITFGSKIKSDKVTEKSLETNTLWNHTVLGGFLKTNADIKELKAVVDWFEHYLRPLVHTKTKLESYVTSKINAGEFSKLDVVNILKKADFHVSDIVIKKEDVDIPDGLLNFMRSSLSTSEDAVKKLEEKGKFTRMNIALEHTVNRVKYTLPLEQESQGTQRYYGLAGLLAMLIKNPTALSIDELESSLHPDLFFHFLHSFLVNTEKSQLLATTHNREILNNRDFFRNDAIWFTDKKEDGATELYSLGDFDSSVIRNTTNILNAYISGKLGGVPNPSDTYIELAS